MKKITRLVSAIALAGYTAGTLAQGTLEEVIVTAQKRAQSIQDVPLSITAFSGDFLEESGIDTMEELARLSPNLTISGSSQATNNRISIRGVGSVGNNGIEPSVGVFIDGVYYPRPGSVIGLMVDIQSFEVLRGPQGTLFGRNTPMGALNVTTRNPTNEFEARIEAGFGDYEAWELGGVVSGPLTDSVAGRLAIKYADRDGYGDNLYDGEEFGARDDLVMRGKLQFDFSDSLTALVTADYSEINGEGSAVEQLNDTANPTFDANQIDLYGQAVGTNDSYDWEINQEHEDDLNDEQKGISIDINYDFANGIRLRSISAYRDWEANTYESAIRLATNILPRSNYYKTETFSQEFHLISPGGETIDWLAGLFYYTEDYDITETFDAGESYCIPTVATLFGATLGDVCASGQQSPFTNSDFSQTLDSIAAFGQVTWNISEQWNATLGARYSSDEKDGDFVQEVYNPLAAPLRAAETVENMERDDSDTTWFANVSWFVTQDIMLFATASTGYKSGGFNSQGGQEALGRELRIFGPEESTNYELGVKSELFDGTMAANITAYRTDLEDFQDRAFDGLSFVVLNAGEVRQQGVEADINWAPIEQLRLFTGISYLDSEYQDFDNAPGLPGGEPQDLGGERKTYSPEWQTSLGGDWTSQLTDNLEWFVGATWSWIDEQNIGTVSNNNPQSLQDSYSLVNARVGIRDVSGKWDVTLYGNNLTDEGYCLAIFDQPVGGFLGARDSANNTMVQRCVLGAPQTWNVRAAYNF